MIWLLRSVILNTILINVAFPLSGEEQNMVELNDLKYGEELSYYENTPIHHENMPM